MITEGEGETKTTPTPASNQITTRITMNTVLVIIGCLIMLANTATEMAYLYILRDNFSTPGLFSIYSAFCGLKLTIPILLISINIIRSMVGKD
jgi:hypothetical protein